MVLQDSLERAIQTSKQLLVEGRTPEMFFRELIGSSELRSEIQVRSFGSISNLSGYLKTFCGMKDFREKVNAVGIVRDADGNAASAFQSVCSSLASAGLERPTQIGSCGTGNPRTGVFILPDCGGNGMLETLCWQVLEHDPNVAPQLRCVTAYLDCLRAHIQIRNEAKAKIWVYLAGRGDFDPLVGRAAQAKVWDRASPVLGRLFTFLHSL